MVKFYKQYFSLIFEIIIAVFMIIYGYVVWENFDSSYKEIARENIISLKEEIN